MQRYSDAGSVLGASDRGYLHVFHRPNGCAMRTCLNATRTVATCSTSQACDFSVRLTVKKIDPARNAASAVIYHAPESTMVMGIAALIPSYALLQLNLRKA
jgi:hypothetical protein